MSHIYYVINKLLSYIHDMKQEPFCFNMMHIKFLKINQFYTKLQQKKHWWGRKSKLSKMRLKLSNPG